MQGLKNRLTGRHGAEANGAHQSREETPDAAVLRQQLVEVGIVRRSGQAVDLGHGGFEGGLGHDREDHCPEIAVVDGDVEHQSASLAQGERRGVKIAQATQPRFPTFADRVNKHPGDEQVEQVEHIVLRARFQRPNESQQGGAAAFVRQPGDRLGLGGIGEARQRQHTGLRQPVGAWQTGCELPHIVEALDRARHLGRALQGRPERSRSIGLCRPPSGTTRTASSRAFWSGLILAASRRHRRLLARERTRTMVLSSTLALGSNTLCVTSHAVAWSNRTLGRSVPVQHSA